MKSIFNIFKGKDGKEKSDKRRVQFDRRIQVCKNSTPIKHQQQRTQQQQQPFQQQKKSYDDMFIGKTVGYNTPSQPRTRKPLESCPGNIAAATTTTMINSSPSTNSETENAIDRQTSFSSENEIDYYARYKHYKKLSRVLSHQNNNLQLRLYQFENQPSSSTAMNYADSDELQRLRIENAELRSRYNQLTVDIERSLNYQKPSYFPPPPSATHHLMDHHRPAFNMYPLHHHPSLQQYPPGFHPYPSSTATNYPIYSPTLDLDIPRNVSSNGQYDPSETDNTDQGEHGSHKNIFGNSIPKVADVTASRPSTTPVPSDEDIC
uniref:Uncharacterized protein n=1 Tax=Panagrolaimus sp. ES5 TaxID=591445 RepID=A0AC34GQ66_9BILA